MLVAQGMTLAVYDLCVPSRSSYSYQCNPGGMCLGKPGSQCRERHVTMRHSLEPGAGLGFWYSRSYLGLTRTCDTVVVNYLACLALR